MSTKEGNLILNPGEGKTVLVPGHKITHKISGDVKPQYLGPVLELE